MGMQFTGPIDIIFPCQYDHHVITFNWYRFKPDLNAAREAVEQETIKLIQMINGNKK